ncbi:hypothetical protein M3I54_22630 [Paraburkholderia sp. CNPSo 3274]|uniref:hypothetical protein n=1 Tax=Paraburkholderia sp. CNPSo 3274 TaxID=2940932 RepID=UPI0020B84178|nr:hypothetical protein [Paraburkholderia sp. CNPSo 3274]MCP3709743.1 hypothetical protein [Paraburkholderia sp. CNPSo 3274]
MSLAKYRVAFNTQRHGAARRGIGWELTFEQWLEWWGADIERRGTGECNLQMQRIADAGPYAIGNIKKGTPKQNSSTAAIVRRNEACERAAEIRRQLTSDLMEDESGEKVIHSLDEDERELFLMFWPRSSSSLLVSTKS